MIRAKTAAPVKPSRPWMPFATVGALLTIVAWLVYGPGLNGPFLLDDTYLPFLNPNFERMPMGDWLTFIRPLLNLSFWFQYRFAGTEPWSYHAVNLLLHIANTALTFVIVRKVLEWAGVEARRLRLLAAFAAGLFLVHPLQTEAVTYVASRSETLSLFFFDAALAIFVCRRVQAISVVASMGVLFFYALACLTKEQAAVLPALLVLTDLFWNPGGLRRNWKLYVPMVVFGAAGLAFVAHVLRSATTAGFGMKDLTWYQYFFTQCRAIWAYLWLFLFPVGLNVDRDFATSRDILDQGALLGLLALALLVATALVYRKRYPLASYGILVFLALIAPTSSLIPIRDTLVERRMYLPFLGLLFVVVDGVRRWNARETTVAVTLGAVLLAESALCFQRNLQWASAVALWKDSAEKSPGKSRPHFQLAFAYYQAGQCREASAEFARTAQLEPPDYRLLIDWSEADDCAGNESGALEKLRQAAKIEASAQVYALMGKVEAKQGHLDEALKALDVAQKLNPNFLVTYLNRGNVYLLRGDKARAAESYRRALEIDPSSDPAREALRQVQ